MRANTPPRPRKRFGQNFLHDLSVIQQIIETIRPKTDDRLIEIGPGLGAITKPLLEQVSQLDIIELDRDLVGRLKTAYQGSKKLVIHQGDALTFDYSTLVQHPGQRLRLVGNLPYNISTPLLFHLLKFFDHIQDMHFMLQKEMANRLTATPNHKAYGKLSILIQYFCKATALFSVEPQAFYPVPKVRSAFIRLTPHHTVPFPPCSLQRLREITTQAFNQRRKTLQNCLKAYLTPEDFQQLNILPRLRPEQLSIQEFVQIANYLDNKERAI